MNLYQRTQANPTSSARHYNVVYRQTKQPYRSVLVIANSPLEAQITFLRCAPLFNINAPEIVSVKLYENSKNS